VTRSEVVLIVQGRQQMRSVNIADALLRDRAPGVEVAAGRWIDGGGDFALQNGPIPGPVRIGNRDRRQQGLGVGMERVRIQSLPFGDLDDAPEVHDRNPVADVLDDCKIVSDE
jgi:hypothetical protein